MTTKHSGKAIFIFCTVFVAGNIGLLWAWNTLAELFHMPLAQYKHAIAASLLAFLLAKTWHVARRNRYTQPRH